MRDIAANHHTATAVPRGLVIVGAASASWLMVGATGLAIFQVLALLGGAV